MNIKEKLRTSMFLESANNALPSWDEELLKKAVEAIDAHIDDPGLDVQKLGNCLALSSNQVYRKIKDLTGYTANEFIRIHRLKTAANLLVQRKRNIAEVVYCVGFSSPSYFSRCFKDQYGCAPSQFIKKYVAEESIVENNN